MWTLPMRQYNHCMALHRRYPRFALHSSRHDTSSRNQDITGSTHLDFSIRMELMKVSTSFSQQCVKSPNALQQILNTKWTSRSRVSKTETIPFFFAGSRLGMSGQIALQSAKPR